MQQEKVSAGSLVLFGLTVRTNKKQEINPSTAKIGKLVERYHQEQHAQHLMHRKSPGVTYCAYTDYERDETEDFIARPL